MEVRLSSCFLMTPLQIQLSVINASGAVTVKDVAAKEFIEAFSKHLKKGNKIKMPDVSQLLSSSMIFNNIIIFISGVNTLRLLASRTSLLMTLTGCTLELPQLLTNSTSEERLESQPSRPTTVEREETVSDLPINTKLPVRSSDTASSNSKSQVSSVKSSTKPKMVQSNQLERP